MLYSKPLLWKSKRRARGAKLLFFYSFMAMKKDKDNRVYVEQGAKQGLAPARVFEIIAVK